MGEPDRGDREEREVELLCPHPLPSGNHRIQTSRKIDVGSSTVSPGAASCHCQSSTLVPPAAAQHLCQPDANAAVKSGKGRGSERPGLTRFPPPPKNQYPAARLLASFLETSELLIEEVMLKEKPLGSMELEGTQ